MFAQRPLSPQKVKCHQLLQKTNVTLAAVGQWPLAAALRLFAAPVARRTVESLIDAAVTASQPPLMAASSSRVNRIDSGDQ
jgi:hypothetical protein